MGKFIITYADYGKPPEMSTVTFTGVDLTDTNIVAQTTLADNLRVAAEKLMLGGVQRRQLVAWVNETRVDATSPFAQRETKWLVKYHDSATGKPASLEMPCANLVKLDPDNSDKALMTDPDVVDFVTLFESFQRSADGNAVVVDEILFVGRKS